MSWGIQPPQSIRLPSLCRWASDLLGSRVRHFSLIKNGLLNALLPLTDDACV
jgi:hypothetical protein